MQPGGALLTLTFCGANRVMPNYNVMGVAKAALEASVRYLAADYGPQGIRVNAISAGLIRTLAGAGIADGRVMYSFQKAQSPLRRGLDLSDIGGAALYLLSHLSSGVTGEIHCVDAGYNIVLVSASRQFEGRTCAGIAGPELRPALGLSEAPMPYVPRLLTQCQRAVDKCGASRAAIIAITQPS